MFHRRIAGEFPCHVWQEGMMGARGSRDQFFLSCFKEHRIFLNRICQIRLQFWCLGFRNFGSVNWILFFFDAQKLGQDGSLSDRSGMIWDWGIQEWSLGINRSGERLPSLMGFPQRSPKKRGQRFQKHDDVGIWYLTLHAFHWMVVVGSSLQGVWSCRLRRISPSERSAYIFT